MQWHIVGSILCIMGTCITGRCKGRRYRCPGLRIVRRGSSDELWSVPAVYSEGGGDWSRHRGGSRARQRVFSRVPRPELDEQLKVRVRRNEEFVYRTSTCSSIRDILRLLRRRTCTDKKSCEWRRRIVGSCTDCPYLQCARVRRKGCIAGVRILAEQGGLPIMIQRVTIFDVNVGCG